MQYYIITSHSHTQAFAHLERGLDEFLDDYLHHLSEPLSKIYNTSDISIIPAEGTTIMQ